MGKKRKSVASRLDEVDRTMYSTFCSAANSLSQLYSQAMNQQKVSFQAGERHALEKLYQWILRQHEEGSRVTSTEIVAYLQNEIDCGEDAPVSPRCQSQHGQSTMVNFMNSGAQVSQVPFGQVLARSGSRAGNLDQNKNSVFSNALSSPVRRNLQSYQFAQSGYYPNSVVPDGNGSRNSEASNTNSNRDSHPVASNDSSMDMHSE